ncbi:sodium-dependent glucose transporter 1 [Microcaecilia unicolor]|uniref:Sodium-dependent glucose transporter 1 n=1 Tax=Microcaecilia unicolor TaxID=1415580 RepID=A0A6P7XWJ6_9AMPH|nr:sodium-dependent glucose transporter 1 [Microcaecilia unicolor]
MGGSGGERKKQVRFARAPAEEEEEEAVMLEKRSPAGLEVQLQGFGPRRKPGRDVRWCGTVVMCASFLGLGMAIAVLGPTFPDLASNVHNNVGNISYIFVGRSLGYLGGSMVGGILFDCMNHHLLLGLSMLWTAVGLYAIPWCAQAISLTAIMAVIGISMGFLDTGGNVVILNIWAEQAGPHVQALHFSFALGAFVAPILAKLSLEFLSGPEDAGNSLPMSSPTPTKAQNPVDHSPFFTKLFELMKSGSMLSYIVIGTYILLVSLLLLILYSSCSPGQEKLKASTEKAQAAKYHNAILFLLFLFFFWYVGAEVAYGSYIFTYAKTHVKMLESPAAGLNSVFWGTFATVRGLAICFATCLYPGTMIILSVIGCTLSSLSLVLFSKNTTLVWVGTAVYGASMATTFPSGISWVKQYTTIGGKSASFFVVGAALGEMVIPAVVGFLQGKFPDIPVLMYMALGSSVITAVLFPVMYKLATSECDGPLKARVESEDQKALLSGLGQEEEEDEDAQQWNEVDFEVIEMSNTTRNSVVQISGDIPKEPSTKTGKQLPLHSLSPRKKLLNLDREKND